VLLPTEADLCNALGITEEEYFQFLEGVAAKVKEQPEAYGLVPGIFAGPGAGALALYQTVGGVTSLTFLGQVAVGVALTAASVLLAPKPPSMRQGTQERTADIGGTKKFAPQFSFNSVQDLANLGDLIPLVFTNRQLIDGITYGGIRVNSQLLWSQMVSLGSYQQLKILALFSLGEIAKRPDLKGYAIGDLLLENYHAEKIYKLIYSNDGYGHSGENIPFLRDGGIIPNNIFKVDDKRHFSGTRNPTTQATFGLSNPMPNATAYKLPYQLVRTPSNTDTDEYRPAGRITYKKRRKLLGAWPMRAGFVNSGNSSQQAGNSDATLGGFLTYQIVGSGRLGLYEGIGYQQDSSDVRLTMDPHGVEDINSATKTVREATDSYLAIGEQYMAGSTLLTCTQILEDNLPVNGRPWDGTKIRSASFKVIETGRYESVDDPNSGLGPHCGNPYWDTNGDFFTVRPGRLDTDDHFYYEQNFNDIFNPNSRYALQKATLGTISNNRKCHITEIGIKSKVFKEIQFANVNSKPTEEKIYEIYDHNSSLTLGNINKFITRYSFFKLQVRKVGQDTWNWLKPSANTNVHTGLFCVRGNTPEFQYNYIRIDQPTLDQYEYRFFPWPGAAVVKEVQAYEARQRHNPINAIVLNSNGARTAGSIDKFTCTVNGEDFVVQFAGDKNYVLTKQKLSNIEWNLGSPDEVKVGNAYYQVTGFQTTHDGSRNDYSIINLPIARSSVPIFTNKLYYPGFGGYPSNWQSMGDSAPNHTVIVRFDNTPSAGYTTWSLYINKADVTKNIEELDGPKWGRSQIKEPGDNSPVEFHYTTIHPVTGRPDRGGKFFPGTNQTANLYGVSKEEQTALTATPYFQGEVEVETDEDDGSGLKANVVVYSLGVEWYAEWSLSDVGQGYSNNQTVYIDKDDIFPSEIINAGYGDITFKVDVNTSSSDIYSDEIGSAELNPYDAASDFWQYEGDRSSHLDGPEHQITYCNEIVETEGDRREGEPATYEKLAYAGLRINSSKEWTNFSQFSAYFKEGVKVKSLIDGTRKATSLFPEIAYALLTDKTLGAGAVISESSVDDVNMTVAAEFCKANNLFWDGMVADRVNLREFIYQQALYCLLDFTIIGGKFSLYPAVPFDPNTFEIDLDGPHSKPKIKAMFTDGNISDLSVSFLSPEDRQAFKANVLYRQEQENGFPERKSAVIQLAEEKDANGNVLVSHVDDPLETFDLSGFCTSRAAAVLFAKYTLVLRKHLDHTVSFKTAPHYINGVRPGDYIRVFSTTQHVQRFNNGAILEDGTVVSKDTISGSKNFYYWNPSTIVAGEIMPVTEATVDFSNTNAVKAFAGSLFTIKEEEASDQCYKVESITFGDDGLVQLTGSYAELTADGKLAMLQNWSNSNTLIFTEGD
tara:strand:- start:43 stop:4206 length:4164 start_codon:yes stop_codon:yes gene_type:complete